MNVNVQKSTNVEVLGFYVLYDLKAAFMQNLTFLDQLSQIGNRILMLSVFYSLWKFLLFRMKVANY